MTAYKSINGSTMLYNLTFRERYLSYCYFFPRIGHGNLKLDNFQLI